MGEPVTTAMVISGIAKLVGPLIAGLTGGGRKVDVEAEIAKLFDLYSARLDPAINAQARAGQVSGAGIAQNMATSMGRAGVGRTGVGAAARSIGQSVGNTRAINARGAGAARIAQLVNEALPSILNAKRANALTPNPFQELVAGLGQAEAATGQDPLRAILEYLGMDTPDEKMAKQKAKTNKAHSNNAQSFMNGLLLESGGIPSQSLAVQKPTI